ncbi:MAG: hypothetical protein WBW94_09285, partial [Anaerolineales bacterium]
LLQSALATLVMSAVILGWLHFASGFSVWIIAPVGIIAGGIVYVAIMYMLRVPELKELTNAIQRRLIKK